MSEGTIEIQAAGRKFGPRWVLRDVNLSVPEGAVYGLLGRNGAGKTTTVRMLFGLLQPTEGKVRVAGVDPRKDPLALRRAVGYAGEDLGLYPSWKVSRILDFAARMYDDWDAPRAEELRNQFDLHPDRRVRELSAGTRARLELLLALARNPRVLLLDEPFGGLDVVVRREVLEGVIDLLSGGKSTVFVTSHLVHELERLVDHVAILRHGSISFAGTLESLHDSVRRIRLGASDRAPDLETWSWIHRAERAGRGWELTVLDFRDTYIARLNEAGFVIDDVHALSLEDIAYEYLREEGGREAAA